MASADDKPNNQHYRYLQAALMMFGIVMHILYPLALTWPSGWAWHPGPPHHW